MNILQRVTLILGAIVAVVVYTAPTKHEFYYSKYTPYYELPEFQVLLLSRVVLVLTVTGIVWFALQGFRPDTIDWVNLRKWTKRVYLVLWAGWVLFGISSLTPWNSQVTMNWDRAVLVLVLIPAGLYVLPWIINVIAKWAGRSVEESEKKGGGKGRT